MGIDSPAGWIAAITGLTGTIINAHYRNRWCFGLWLVSNLIWMTLAITDRAWPLAAQMGIYAIIAVDGWIRWSRMERETIPSGARIVLTADRGPDGTTAPRAEARHPRSEAR